VKILTKAAVPLAAATRHAVFNGVSDSSVNNVMGRHQWNGILAPSCRAAGLHAVGKDGWRAMTHAEIYSARDHRAHSQGHTLNVACGPVKDRVERSGGDTGGQDGEEGNQSRLHFVVMRVDEIDERKCQFIG
jgi:hypothetical protein